MDLTLTQVRKSAYPTTEGTGARVDNFFVKGQLVNT
jgi:hypothetical protein